MAGNSTVGINIVGRDLASPAFLRAARNAEASSSRMNKAFKSSIGMAAKLAGGFAAFELVKKAIDIGKEAAVFQSKMLLIQTQAGATAGEVRAFSTALLSMSGRVAKSPEDLATSLYHVYSTGLRGAEALKVVEVAAKGARIGMADLEETTNALTSTVVSGIKGAKDMGQAMGMLNVIVGSGDMKLSDLNEALGGGILAVAKGFGISLTEVGAALAVFGDNNIRGAEAATQLRMAIMALAKPVAGGAKALADIGLTSGRLKNDLASGGLTKAVDDLNRHMVTAGITGSKIGGFLTDAFGRRAGVGLAVLMGQVDRFHVKLSVIAQGAHDFDKSWSATTKTASFVFARLGTQVTATGISFANKLLPSITQAAAFLGDTLPGAVSKLAGILAPFGSYVGGALSDAWHILGVAFTVVAAALTPIVGLLDAIKGPLGAVATVAIGAVLAFKLFAAIPGILETVALKMMYARDSVVGFGVASKAMATNFVASSAVVVGAAEATSLGVVESGAAARVGWAGILGPLGAVAVGVGLLVTMFHRSSGASKEAAAAAKAYTEALTGGGGKTNVIDSITTQLTNAKLPENLRELAKSFGKSAFTGKQFVDAIQSGGKPLDALRDRLKAVVKAGTSLQLVSSGKAVAEVKKLTPAAQAAQAALGHLNTQFTQLSKATKKDLLDTKTFAGSSSSIVKVSQATQVASDTAKQYAEMLGIAVDKNGVAAVSAKTLAAAVDTVSKAYDTASGAGDDFLKALNAFSSSAGTAADRATLIGATLKAANGDALGFASAMTAAYAANRDLTTAFGTDASNIADLRKQIADLTKTSDGSAATTQKLADLQSKLHDAYKNSERAAINLNTGTINYAKGGAPALVGQLQAIQDASVKAASAVYQHEVATKGAKKAADDAYKVYVSQTRGQLIDEATQLGLTKTQAKKLADQYFGMPKDVKTLIETEGTNPVVDVLNKIGKQLSFLTGHAWAPKVTLTGNAAAEVASLRKLLASLPTSVNIGASVNANGQIGISGGGHYAKGSSGVPDGMFTVGEQGYEIGIKRGSNLQIISHPQSVAMTGRKRVPGFAAGTGLSDVVSGIAGLLAAGHNRLSTASDLSDAAKSLRDAAKSAKVSAGEFANMLGQSAALTRLGKARDAVSAALGSAPTRATAYDKLAAAQGNYSGERSSVRGAITGSFDISQAGTSQFGEPVTLVSIRSQLAKAVANARRFTAVLKRLGREGLNRSLLSQLAEAGPSALPQALALASATPKELASINSQYRSLGAYGGSAGKYLADQMYGAGVNSAQALVNGLKSKEAALTKAIRSIANGMVATLRASLDMHSPSRRLYDEARLAFTGYENGIHSKHGDIARAAGRIGGASIPANGARAARGAGSYVNIEKQELHVHYPESGDVDGALRQLTRMTVHQMRAASQELGR